MHSPTTAMNTPPAPLTLCEFVDPGLPGLESYSPFCVKVHRALRAANLPYTRRHGAHPGVFKKLNPNGQLPVLLIGDEPIADSTAILHRIEAMVPGSMTGAGGREAAEAWLWEDYADSCLNGYLVASRWADERNWPSVKIAYFNAMPALIRAVLPGRLRSKVVGALVARDVWRAGSAKCWERFEASLDQLEVRAPREGFWVGATVTAADVAIFGQLHGMRSPLTPWQQAQLAQRKGLSAYLDRVDARTRLAEPAATAQAA
ncbi:MAG: glutathione S-transferase family protein [Byssovorax sp.]